METVHRCAPARGMAAVRRRKKVGKIDAMMAGRNEGLAYALEIVKKGGQEALEEEIRLRRLQGISLNVSAKELEAAKRQITRRTVDVVCAAACLTLHDAFGFGQQRALKFLHRFESKIDAAVNPTSGVTLEDYLAAVKDEMGIDLQVSRGLGV